MNVLDKIILIHPTKSAGTTISERLFKLRGFLIMTVHNLHL
jgi:hypothetical protein